MRLQSRTKKIGDERHLNPVPGTDDERLFFNHKQTEDDKRLLSPEQLRVTNNF